MSSEYKLNKSELGRLRREGKLYGQYLPVLKLKQEQIQLEENRLKKLISEERLLHAQHRAALEPYIPLLTDQRSPLLQDLLVIAELKTEEKSLAGIKVKRFERIVWQERYVPYFATAPWLVRALPLLKNLLSAETKLALLNDEQAALVRELRKATQKVNLFDMVLIPKTKAAIKRIAIALGDEQVASVSRGKIAKAKKVKR